MQIPQLMGSIHSIGLVKYQLLDRRDRRDMSDIAEVLHNTSYPIKGSGKIVSMAREAAAQGNPGVISSLSNVVEILALREDISSLRREGICKFHS
ncbi:hypothetical protein [Candidatus Liberibacter sp.]|uniref:hypothetical protein n=1 Tax=Candidatus Liberibacter sp. TaxID=34022 RepID=UPI0015F6582F|nr:hypothetical protein [Candidatus Liberibacter sp.]MBA5724053.1 hypothetical protein [Candidatus Liberibacter sp.]